MDEDLRKLLRRAETARLGGASLERVNEELAKLTDGEHTLRSLADIATSEGVPLRGPGPAPSREPTAREAALQRINARGGSAVGDLLRMGAQGASFGFADEIAGGAAALGAMVPGGRSPGQAFRQTTDASRQRVEDLRTTAPLASFLAEGVGALATGAGASRLPLIAARPVAAAIAGGAAYGAGEGEGVRGRAGGAAVGAGLGAGGGLAVKATPALLRGGRRALTRGGRATERTAGRVAGSIDEAAERAGPVLQGLAEDAGLKPGLMSNRPAALRSAFEEAGGEAGDRIRAEVLGRVAEDLTIGDLSVSQLAGKSGLSRLEAILPSEDFARVSKLLKQDASAARIASALRTVFKVGAGTGAGLGLLNEFIGG